MSDVPPPPTTPPPGYLPFGVPSNRPQPNKKAITSFVLGLIGLFCIPVVLSVLALVYGIQARGEIDRSAGAYGNRGLATAGIVLGIIGIVLGAIFIAQVVENHT